MRLLAQAAGADRPGSLVQLLRVPFPPHWRVIGNGLLAGACRLRGPTPSRVREQLAQLADGFSVQLAHARLAHFEDAGDLAIGEILDVVQRQHQA